MNVGKALFEILSTDAGITAICSTRVYPEIADQDAALPFIVYKVSDINPSGTKSGSSSLDTARVDVYCVADEYGDAMDLSDAARTALDRVGGTYNSVAIQSIDFDTADVEYDQDQRAYIAESTYNVRVQRIGQAPDVTISPLSILTVEEVDGTPTGTVNKLVVSNGSLTIDGSTATVQTGGNVTSVNTETGDVVLDADDISDAATTNKFATQAQLDKVDHLTVTQAVDLDTIESDTATNNAKVGYTDGAVDARIAAASITDLNDTPGALGTNGQVLAVNSGGTALEFVDQSTVSVQYHDRYSTEAESERSGATATLEVYYTARPDGDGYAESEVSDVGETDTINRTLYYSDKFQADPDTAGDWTEYTTQPADNATFATAKAALLAGLNETDATAETRGTLPLSLKMVRTTTAAVVELLLDTYTGASAAYSVRKLRSAHTGACMRIRRASDDAETDIGFDLNGDLDTAAIASHCGASAGYCVTWVDQSGNGNNVTQSTSGSQPQIYNGTAVITENGKPAIYFADYNYQLANTSGTWGGTNVLTCDFVNVHTLVSGSGLGGGASSEKHFLFWYDGAFQVAQIYLGTYYLGWSRTTTGPSADTNQHLWYGIASNGTGQIRVDGTASTAGTLNTSRYFSGEFAFNGRPGAPTTERGVEQYQQEFIQWDVNQSAGNRTGIETDIDTYFSIT